MPMSRLFSTPRILSASKKLCASSGWPAKNSHALAVGEFPVPQRLLPEQPQHRVPEEPRVLPVVEPKRDLVQVGRKMLGGELVVGADDRALEQTPDAFHGVGMDLRPNPLFGAVVHPLVARVVVPDSEVADMG